MISRSPKSVFELCCTWAIFGSFSKTLVVAFIAMEFLLLGLRGEEVVLPRSMITNDVAFGAGTLSAGNYRAQQVYSASGFSAIPGSKLIRELRWRPDYQYGGAFTSTLAQLEIRLSTTPQHPDDVYSAFVQNVGPDETVVFSGPITLSSQFVGPPNGPKQFDIAVPLQTPFLYDPTRGDLLVDVLNHVASGASLVAGQAITGDEVSRITGEIPNHFGTPNSAGEVIKFIYTPPTNWTGIAISMQPPNLVREVGGSASFEAITFANGPVHYHWRWNGMLLAGETNASLLLTNLQIAQSGTYEVLASNLGYVTNATAVLLVVPPITSVILPSFMVSNDVAYGNGIFRNGNFRMQQVYSGSAFSPQPGIKLIRELRWRPDYLYGSAFTSTLSQLEIRLSTTQKAPDGLSSIYAQNTGTNQSVVFFGPITLSSQFLGPPNGPKQFDIAIPLQVPFFFDTAKGNLLVDVLNYGASGATFVAGLGATGDEGSRVYGSLTFGNYRDTGADAIQFIFQPSSTNFFVYITPQSAGRLVGESVRLDALSLDGGPFQCLWRHDGNILSGETNSSLLLSNLRVDQSGAYEVTATSPMGAVTNATAYLVVSNAPSVVVIRGPYLQCITTSNTIVRWRTDNWSLGSVRFSTAPDAMAWESFGGQATNNHSVTLTNLSPGAKYFYSVWSGTNRLVSGTNCYVQTDSGQRTPTRIWAIGDVGTATYGAPWPAMVRNAYLQSSPQRHTDVCLMLGDNAYEIGTDAEYQVAVFDVFSSMLSRFAVWPTIGNHEAFGGLSAFLNIFSLPMAGEAGGVPSGSELYYSFDNANVHFVCINSETSSKAPGSPMLTWLEQDLAANTKDWTIAYWHSPPYSYGSHNSDVERNLIQMREQVVPILENYGVDLVLCGHSHSYERSYLLDGHYGSATTLAPSMIKDSGSGRTNDTGAYRKPSTGSAGRQGTVYVVAGSAGQTSGVSPHPAMLVSLNHLGSVVIDIDGDRLDARFLRETGAVDDHFTILKGAAAEPLYIATFRASGGTVTAKWKSVAGRVYRIESTLSLASAQWNLVVDNIMATGATTTWSGLADSPTGSAYYRVVQVSP